MKRNALMRNLATSCLLALGVPAKGQPPVDDAAPYRPIPETREELADPPAGEIRKVHLRMVKACRDTIRKAIGNTANSRKTSGYYSSLQSLNKKLDELIETRKQTTYFSLIQPIALLFDEYKKVIRQEPEREYDQEVLDGDVMNALGLLFPPLIHSMAEYVIQQQGEIPRDTLADFVTVFTTVGFIRESDWEGEGELPIGSADFFVANPDAVISLLKAKPCQCARKFIGDGDATAERFFGNFDSDKRAIRKVLGPKYLQNKATLEAKFNELNNWVIQQEQQAKGHK
jgi:hypothetical protein